MKLNAANMTSNARIAEQHSKPAADPGREPIPRRVYVAMRLDEITAAVAKLAREREELTADLKASPSKAGTNQKELRQWRAYVAQRLSILRQEQTALKTEKNILGDGSMQDLVKAK